MTTNGTQLALGAAALLAVAGAVGARGSAARKPISVPTGGDAGARTLPPNELWSLPDDVHEVRFELAERGPWRVLTGVRGLVMDHPGKRIYGVRSMTDIQGGGYQLRGRVSVGGKKRPAFTSSTMFRRPDGSLVNVATIVIGEHPDLMPPPPRRSLRGARNVEVQQHHALTRDGFPWPRQALVYHATPMTRAIRRQGFKTRQQGAPQMLGGAWERSVSFTRSLPRAASIAVGLEALVRGARGEVGCMELLERLTREIPDAFPMAVLSGYNLQWVAFDAAARLGLAGDNVWDLTIPQILDAFRPVFTRLDAGWIYVTDHGLDRAKLSRPQGAIRLPGHGDRWLVPPGSVPDGIGTSQAEAFRDLYKSGLTGCGDADCFDPRFWSTRMDALARVNPSDVGIFVSRLRVPRVATDARGAVRLGYIDPVVAGDGTVRSVLENLHRQAYQSLSAPWGAELQRQRARTDQRFMHDYAVNYRDTPIISSWSGTRTRKHFEQMTGWRIIEEGTRIGPDTMLYSEFEQELIVYDTSKIDNVSLMGMTEVRRHFRLGDRLTFPRFDPAEGDLSVWPWRHGRSR